MIRLNLTKNFSETQRFRIFCLDPICEELAENFHYCVESGNLARAGGNWTMNQIIYRAGQIVRGNVHKGHSLVVELE